MFAKNFFNKIVKKQQKEAVLKIVFFKTSIQDVGSRNVHASGSAIDVRDS